MTPLGQLANHEFRNQGFLQRWQGHALLNQEGLKRPALDQVVAGRARLVSTFAKKMFKIPQVASVITQNRPMVITSKPANG